MEEKRCADKIRRSFVCKVCDKKLATESGICTHVKVCHGLRYHRKQEYTKLHPSSIGSVSTPPAVSVDQEDGVIDFMDSLNDMPDFSLGAGSVSSIRTLTVDASAIDATSSGSTSAAVGGATPVFDVGPSEDRVRSSTSSSFANPGDRPPSSSSTTASGAGQGGLARYTAISPPGPPSNFPPPLEFPFRFTATSLAQLLQRNRDRSATATAETLAAGQEVAPSAFDMQLLRLLLEFGVAMERGVARSAMSLDDFAAGVPGMQLEVPRMIRAMFEAMWRRPD